MIGCYVQVKHVQCCKIQANTYDTLVRCVMPSQVKPSARTRSDVVDLEGVHRAKLFKSMSTRQRLRLWGGIKADTLAVLSRQFQSVEAALSQADQVTGIWH